MWVQALISALVRKKKEPARKGQTKIKRYPLFWVMQTDYLFALHKYTTF